MTKTVFIMRHAKAEPIAANDKSRTLTSKGRHEAIMTAEKWAEQYTHPENVLYSTATRTTQTAEILQKAFHLSNAQMIASDEAYSAGVEDLDHILSGLNDAIQSIVIVGHNNTLTDYLLEKIEHFKIDHLPTSGMVGFELNINSWKENSPNVKGQYKCHLIKSYN